MSNTVDLLKRLVRINSVSGGEEELAGIICQWLKQQGIKVFRQKGNVIAHIKGGNSKKAIIFNGHMDTVPPGDYKKWQNGPFNPTLVGSKLYGLGASDMKGSLVVMMICAKEFVKTKPACDVWFSFVVKEELDGSGTKNFLKWFQAKGFCSKYQELAAIIGEPTGLKEIELGHKGNAFVHVTIFGQTGHGSRPEEIKEHAILKINKLIGKLDKQISVWQKKYKDKYLGVPTVGLTGIKAGLFKCPNKFPDKCKAQFDFRTTPAMHENIKKEIKNWLNGSGAKFEFAVSPASFGWSDPKEKIVQVLKSIVSNVKLTVSRGATDQCFFTKAGIPAIIFGPGEKSLCHKENEWTNVNQLDKAINIYQSIVDRFGGTLN